MKTVCRVSYISSGPIVLANSKTTHHAALLTLKDLWNFEESNNRLFGVLDQSPGPSDGPCHRWLIFSFI